MAFRNLLLFAFLSAACPALKSQQPAENQILKSEDRRFAAMVLRDTGLIRSMLDESLTYTHSNGLTESKTQHLASIGSGTIVYLSMRREPGANVRQFGKTALVNGRVNVSGVLNGKDFKVLLQYSAVYRKKQHRWRLFKKVCQVHD